MTVVAVLIHLLVDFLFGLSVLLCLGDRELNWLSVAQSIGIGMFAETMIIAILHFLGLSILTGFIVFSVLTLIFLGFLVFVRKRRPQLGFESIRSRLHLGVILLSLFLLEKLIWSIWNLSKTPVYFDDTFNHWAGRGRALLGGINWSWDPGSIYFMGGTFGNAEYPLFLSIWKGVNAVLAGGYNQVTDRVDGLIMWIISVIVISSWTYSWTGKKWAGFAAAAVMSAIPIQSWHITAGYAEIFIQAFLLLSLWSIFHGRMVLAGIFGAAMIWSKNEGLVLYLPCIMMALSLHLFSENRKINRALLRDFVKFNVTWMLCIAPWMLFKLYHGLNLTVPSEQGIGYIDGTFQKLIESLFTSPSSGILWAGMLLVLLLNIPKILRTSQLLILTLSGLVLLAMLTFVFTSTGAYIFLMNEMTIHRSLLQIAPIFILITFFALLPIHQEKEMSESLEID